jgi:glycosyltransferase involved in cell wall biosynthesis
MNIALVTKDYNTATVDAAFTTAISLAKELKKKGHNPIMISSKSSRSTWLEGARKPYELYETIPIFRPYGIKWFSKGPDLTIPFNRIIAPALGIFYVQRKLKIKFDVIHSFSAAPFMAFTNFLGQFFAKKANSIHTIKSETLSKFSMRFSRLLNLVNVIVTPTNHIKSQLVKKKVSKNRIHVVHSHIDTNTFLVKNNKKILEKFDIQTSKNTVLYYGKSGYYKGVDILIEAIDRLPKSIKASFVLVHPTVWLAKFRKQVLKNKNANKINIVVKKLNIPELLSVSDIVILPFRSVASTEANPLCLLESMAAKKAIITSDLPEIREILNNKSEAILVKPGNSEALSKAIYNLLTNPKKRKNLGESAHQKSKLFDTEKITEEYLNLYESCRQNS